jgi:hypothetical protein
MFFHLRDATLVAIAATLMNLGLISSFHATVLLGIIAALLQ